MSRNDRMLRWCLWAAPLYVACGPTFKLPSPDSCDRGDSANVGAIAIGTPSASGAFRPFADGDPAPLQRGGQGATMLVMRIAVVGSGAPACLAQSTQVNASFGPIGHDSVPRATYAQPDGSRLTKDMFIVLDGRADWFTVSTTVGAIGAHAVFGTPPLDMASGLD